MSLSSMIQTAVDELGLPRPSSIVGSSNNLARQLLAYANRANQMARDKYEWGELQKKYTITLVSGQSGYAKPGDYRRQIFRTHWDEGSFWEILGPISPQEWEYRESGIVNTTPRFRFRLKGVADSQFFLTPTPATGDAGDTQVFEYISDRCARPATWTASTAFSAGDYTFYNENYYTTTSGGTSGSTPPTHTSGSISDGGVTWTFYDGSYETFLKDTDLSIFDENILALHIQWRFLRSKGLQWVMLKKDADEELRRSYNALKGARTLTLSSVGGTRFISSANVPDTGYGS